MKNGVYVSRPYMNICKKTYQFKTVCKDDVMISVLVWVTWDKAMHMASLQADFSW